VTRLRTLLRAFGAFWWDFLIGDTPEFVLATGVIVALAYGLQHRRVAAVIVLPLVAAGFLLASTYRGRQRTAGPASGPQPGPAPGPAPAEETATPSVPPPAS
jgi:hypothetical protein